MDLLDLPSLKDFPVRNGVHLLCDPKPFEKLYEIVRTKEDRILSDEQVLLLPDGTGLWNAKEWSIRSHSAGRLVHALSRRGGDLRILDVGCGNGWLSALLQRNGHRVLGIDAFTTELEQAARVFRHGPVFARADLFTSPLPEHSFDAVLFAASIQYFADPIAAIQRARHLLAPGGEVHVMDSILYSSKAGTLAAVERSRAYYQDIGVPGMTDQYHAHELDTIRSAGNSRILAAPSGMDRTLARFGRTVSPFTHVVVADH
ncbi:MAG TPA: class I SAM-dependent methyltransferase [Flavobacteriales bacterium]|nr:class I SAM-dependent methyltransferase [Flavobacteriales bacterium]